MVGRSFSTGSYRYGFVGQEKSDEIKGEGNSYTAEFWEYDPRLGRQWNLDPKPIMWESSYAVNGNNPNYFIDPLGDFKTKAGAIWYKLWHGRTVSRNTENNQTHSNEWYVAKKVENDDESGITIQKKYSWGLKFVATAEVAGSIGVQAEVEIKSPEAFKTKFEGKVGGGVAVFELGKVKFGYDGNELIFKPQKGAMVIHNYVMAELGGNVFGKQVGGGIKYDYNFAYYNGYYGPRQDGEASHDFGAYFFGKSFNKGGKKYDNIFNPFSNPLRPKFKTGGKTENEEKFIGTEFGGSLKVILGVDYKIKIGISY